TSKPYFRVRDATSMTLAPGSVSMDCTVYIGEAHDATRRRVKCRGQRGVGFRSGLPHFRAGSCPGSGTERSFATVPSSSRTSRDEMASTKTWQPRGKLLLPGNVY